MTQEDLQLALNAVRGVRVIVSDGDDLDCWSTIQVRLVSLLEICEDLILDLAKENSLPL